MSDLMPKEFYEAFRKHFGFGQLTASASSDAYQMLKAAEWAWKASRECLVIELPDVSDMKERAANGNCYSAARLDQHALVIKYIHAAGVKTK